MLNSKWLSFAWTTLTSTKEDFTLSKNVINEQHMKNIAAYTVWIA